MRVTVVEKQFTTSTCSKRVFYLLLILLDIWDSTKFQLRFVLHIFLNSVLLAIHDFLQVLIFASAYVFLVLPELAFFYCSPSENKKLCARLLSIKKKKSRCRRIQFYGIDDIMRPCFSSSRGHQRKRRKYFLSHSIELSIEYYNYFSPHFCS